MFLAEYIKQEMCDLNGTGEKPVYYRMKIQRNMDMEDFVERITYPGSGLSRGSVIQVMTTVAEHLAYCMAEGQSVTLDGIGTFTPRLGVAKDKEIDSLDGDEPKRNARSIEVNGINYRADKELVREVSAVYGNRPSPKRSAGCGHWITFTNTHSCAYKTTWLSPD